MNSTIEQRKLNRIAELEKRKRRRKKLIYILPAAILLIALVSILYSPATPEEDFKMFADSQYQDELAVCSNMELKPDYAYEEGFSTAVAGYGKADKKLKKFAAEKISKLEDKARTKAKGDNEHALLSTWAVKTSASGAKCLLIYSASYEGPSFTEMERRGDYVKTYYFNEKNNFSLKPLQILKKGYVDECTEKVQNTIAREYKKKYLADDWQDMTGSLNNFMLDSDTLTFYLKAGAGDTVIPVDLPLSKLDKSVRKNLLKRYIEKGDKMVALTFDDGPGGKSEAQILDAMDKYDSVATFFYLGREIKNNSENVKRADELGCEIGSHAWSHKDLKKLSKKEIKKELSKTNKAVKKITGKNPTVFRPPYGSYSDKVRSAAKSYDLPVVLWSVDSLDWQSKNKDKVFKKILETKDLDGRIILCHSIYGSTADAIEELLPWLHENGYQTVTVSELVKYKTGEKPGYDKIY